MKKVLPHERAVMKELAKRLPATAHVYFHFSRGIGWMGATLALRVKPSIGQTYWLDIHMPTELQIGRKLDDFEWKGLKLKAMIVAVDRWLLQRKHLAMETAGAARQLEAPRQRQLPAAPKQEALW